MIPCARRLDDLITHEAGSLDKQWRGFVLPLWFDGRVCADTPETDDTKTFAGIDAAKQCAHHTAASQFIFACALSVLGSCAVYSLNSILSRKQSSCLADAV